MTELSVFAIFLGFILAPCISNPFVEFHNDREDDEYNWPTYRA